MTSGPGGEVWTPVVAEVQNTTVSVLRGTASNAFGDTVDLNEAIVEGLPALLAETGKHVQDPSTSHPRTIREVACHVPQYAGVLNTDRILDESTGNIFMIIGIVTPPTIIGAPVDTVLQLKRVTANTG